MFKLCAAEAPKGEVLLTCPEDFEDVFIPHHPKFASIFGEGFAESPRQNAELVIDDQTTPKIIENLNATDSLSEQYVPGSNQERCLTQYLAPTAKNSDVTASSPATVSTTTGGRTTFDRTESSSPCPPIDLSNLVISATDRTDGIWDTETPEELTPSRSATYSSKSSMGGDDESSTDTASSVDYLPTRTSPVMNLRVPKLDLVHMKLPKRKHRPKQQLAMDVADLLTNNTFALSDSMQGSVQFQTIKPGAACQMHFNTAQPTCHLMKKAEAQDRRGKSKGVSFTGPGFAILPQSKDSELASSESVPVFRKSTFQPADVGTADSPRSIRTRDYTNPYEENQLTGMFKSKKDLRRKTFFDDTHVSHRSSSVECREEISPLVLAVVKRDITRLREASDIGDVETLIELLDCYTRLPPELSLVKQAHPWTSLPESIDALAASQLAVLASSDKFNQNQIERLIQKLKPLLMDTARADETEAALLALNYIIGDVAKNAQCLYDNGYLPLLIKLMHKEKEGVQAAAARLCRNIFTLRPECRYDFRNLGGMHGLLSLLKPDRSYDLQLEALYYMEDLILQNGEEIPEFIESVKVLSIGNLLEKLLDVSDASLATVAKQLYLRIAD